MESLALMFSLITSHPTTTAKSQDEINVRRCMVMIHVARTNVLGVDESYFDAYIDKSGTIRYVGLPLENHAFLKCLDSLQ